MQRRTVLVFVKYPAQGRVKTRLARTLGDAEAVAIYRRLVSRVFENLSSAPHDRVVVLFDPPDAGNAVREWLKESLGNLAAEVEFVPQDGGDLGDRLREGFRHAFESGADAVAAIGTDCVAIDGETFAATWRSLERHDAVFGPTADGGYYLVAVKARQDCLFDEIPWSSEHTLSRSMQQAEQHGLSVDRLATLADVDTADDWEKVREAFFPDVEPA